MVRLPEVSVDKAFKPLRFWLLVWIEAQSSATVAATSLLAITPHMITGPLGMLAKWNVSIAVVCEIRTELTQFACQQSHRTTRHRSCLVEDRRSIHAWWTLGIGMWQPTTPMRSLP
jgi:hypothetical protein